MSEAKGKKSTIIPKEFIKKEEKAEIHPMSYYIDDRVELVKQIFSTLKTKTIKSLAPSFLKNSKIEEIEELCLNELLGISTKRLQSIINATKCPSDTESSEDDDVNPIEEHISLEEISSESESEKTKKIVKKPAKMNDKESEGNEKKPAGSKEVSVLELLELQARARAIRSQLALEPITKIEVDSDDSGKSKKPKNTTVKKDKSTSSTSKVLTNGTAQTSKEAAHKTRKRKLRKRSSSKSDPIESKEGKGKFNKIAPKETQKSNETRSKTLAEQAIKEEERSPSPDVITILPSPETLFISDSSDDDTTLKKTEDPKPTTSNEGITTNSSKEEEETKEKENIRNEETNQEKDTNETNKITAERRNSTEISSVIKDKEKEEDKSENQNESIKIAEENDVEISESRDDVISLGNEELEFEMSKTEDDDTDIKQEVQSADLQESTSQQSEDTSKEELTDIAGIADDYIELNLSSDTDMEETIQNRSTEKTSENTAIKEDISWNSRWLRSTKVTKVLATSKLGNRLRNKLKMRKVEEAAEQLKEAEISAEIPEENEVFKSQYEDGSVKQYEEIMDHLQSKKDSK